MQKEYLLPASILLGCCVIGLGLFLGLRASSPAPGGVGSAGAASVSVTLGPPGGSPASAPAAAISGAGTAGAPPPSLSAGTQAQFEQAARAALAAEKKATFLPACWEPAIKSAPLPARAKFSLDVTFDAQGIEVARGISDDRSAPRNDVGICLRKLPMGLKLSPPPGVSVRVELPLELP